MRLRRRRSEPARLPADPQPNVGSPVDHRVHRGRIDTHLEPDYTPAEVREMRWLELPDEDPPRIHYHETPTTDHDRFGPWDG